MLWQKNMLVEEIHCVHWALWNKQNRNCIFLLLQIGLYYRTLMGVVILGKSFTVLSHPNKDMVRRHSCEKMWTFCQNTNKSATIIDIYYIEGRNFKISKDLLQMYTFLSLSSPTFSQISKLFLKKVWSVQIRKIWFADILRLFSCLT